MQNSIIKNKLLNEISKIPEDQLKHVYNFIHYFRLGLKTKKPNPEKIMELAGSWIDMPDKDFDTFMSDIKSRRSKAFESRRNRETSAD